MKGVLILDVKIHAIRSQEILKAIDEAVRSNEKRIFEYANIHTLNLACEHRWFKDFLNKTGILYTDGAGVGLGAWLLGYHIPERIILTTWVWELLGWCATRGYSVFFLGSGENVVQQTVENARKRLPNLRIVGAHHGFFEKKGVASDMVIEKINALCPNVLFVGFGMPLQEKWVDENWDKIQTNAIFLAGSCFEYMAGAKTVCPCWISNIGFEWLYRLVHEPRRLFKRYMIGNPLFLIRVLRQKLRRKG